MSVTAPSHSITANRTPKPMNVRCRKIIHLRRTSSNGSAVEDSAMKARSEEISEIATMEPISFENFFGKMP